MAVPHALRVLLVAALAVIAGCAAPVDDTQEPPPFTPPAAADYPDGAPAACPPAYTRTTFFPLATDRRAEPRDGARNSVHVEGADPARPEIVWVWQHVAPGERPDALSRIRNLQVAEAYSGERSFICATMDVLAPTAETRPAEDARTLHVVLTPDEPLPPGNYTVIVNWNVGCPSCDTVPRGNATAAFVVPAS